MTYQFKTEPLSHQLRIFNDHRDTKSFGILWEQGTGKTKAAIDNIAYLYQKNEIDAALVLAPNGVHRNWISDELPKHLPDAVAANTKMMYWDHGKANTQKYAAAYEAALKHPGLLILTVGYSSFISENTKKAVWKFLKRRKVMYIADESHSIKTPKAKRTKSIIASSRYAAYRRILTGTPGDKPFDLYSQLRFLDPGFWSRRNISTYHEFKQRYAEWFTAAEAEQQLGYNPGYDQLIRYKNMDELAEALKTVSDRVLKEDVLDLPPKLYTKLYFDMTPKQRRMYEELRDKYELELENGLIIDGSMAIVRLLRLQQIACGYAVADVEEPVELCDKTNPRLELATDYLKELPHQAIVWCRFRHDIDQIMDVLGDKAVRYDGSLDDDGAERNKLDFNAGKAQFFVANPQKGATGLTLIGAKTTLYYSNSFKLLERLQTEDRNHRFGQDGVDHNEHGFGVLYADIIAEGTVDHKIINALRDKFDVANQLTGDRLKDWI
jgi:SNF2 family DNA or RNA helicase